MSPAIRIAIPNTKRLRFQYQSCVSSSKSLNTTSASALFRQGKDLVALLLVLNLFIRLKGFLGLDGGVVCRLDGSVVCGFDGDAVDRKELSDSTFALIVVSSKF